MSFLFQYNWNLNHWYQYIFYCISDSHSPLYLYIIFQKNIAMILKKLITYASYGLLTGLVLVAYNLGNLQEYIFLFTVAYTLFIIRDMISFFGIPKETKHIIFDWKKFWNDITKKHLNLSKKSIFLILNREIFFPMVVTICIFLLFFQEIQFPFVLDLLDYSMWIEYILFGGLAITAFFTIFRESGADTYYRLQNHTFRMRIYLCCDIFLSLWTTAIILSESTAMWLLSIPISIISWILLFAIGILFLRESDSNIL